MIRNQSQEHKQFTIAMATDTQQIQKTVEIKAFTNLWTPKNDMKSEPGKQQIYDCYGHRHTKQFQKTVEILTFLNLRTPKHDTTSDRKNNRFTMAMATDTQSKSRKP